MFPLRYFVQQIFIQLKDCVVKNEPIIIEKTFNTRIEKVWKAITEKEQMQKWYFNIAEFKLEVGFEFQFYAGDDKKQWLHVCKVTEVIPKKILTYSWRYEGYSGISFVTFELFSEGEKTRLRLTHTGLDSFPSDVPGLKKENFIAGWESIIGTSLKQFMEK